MKPKVQITPLNKLVDQNPLGAGDTKTENSDEISVMEIAKSLHLSPKLAKSLEGIGIELLHGDGAAVGELSLVDEAEAAVADDEICGEVSCGGEDFSHGNLERRVEGQALVNGDGSQPWNGNASGIIIPIVSIGGIFFVFVVFADEEDCCHY